MRIVKETKAVTTLILILLLLCSFILGALASYFWVMSSFYVEQPPENISLEITDLKFPVDHADYFNVTVLNPSHSASSTNITQIYLTVEGEENVTRPVTATEPESYPILLERATTKTIKCIGYWGDFAGKNITTHVKTLVGVGESRTEQAEFVDLNVTTHFDASTSVKYFNVTVKNDEASAINLTMKSVYFRYYYPVPQENLTIQLPKTLENGTSVSFDCIYEWNNTENPTVIVETSEGYIGLATANVSSKMNLYISDITFDEANATLANVTIVNSEESVLPVHIARILFTYENGTQYNIIEGYVIPGFQQAIETNSSETFTCLGFPWMDYRSKNVTVTAYTKEGFVSSSKTKVTPAPILFNISATDFNLTNTGSFTVNITNMASSTQEINVTQIKLNDNIIYTSQPIPVGEQRQITCAFDWASLRDTTATISVNASGVVQNITVTLPSVDLKISDTFIYGTGVDGSPHVNVTIVNTAFSARSVNISKISFKTEDRLQPYSIDGTISVPQFEPNGYILDVGASVTIECRWDSALHPNQDLTVTVQMTDGTTVSQTFHIP